MPLRSTSLLLFLAFCCLNSCQKQATETSDSRPGQPNILFIFADDLGYGDLGSYGNDSVQTPTLDSLAEAGLLLENHYTVHPICSPARAALLTGIIPARFGLTGVLFPKASSGLPDSIATMPEVLQTGGYRTAMIGKWHLGTDSTFLPTSQGFDSYFGIPYSNDMEPLIYMQDDQVLDEAVSQSKITQRYTQEAVNVIRNQSEQPLFLYLAHSMPHIPIEIDREDSRTGTKSRYLEAVEGLDRSTRSLLNGLRREGMLENTIIIFTSDNGPWLGKADQSGSAGMLREGKFSSFEGGCKVPAIVAGPGITPGRASGPVSLMDWFPTLCAAAGVTAPRNLDGQSLSPLFAAQEVERRPVWFFEDSDKIQAVRKGKWKLKQAHPGTEWANLPEHGPLLFDLEADPGEQRDLSSEHPRIAGELAWMIDSMQATLPDSIELHFGFW